MNRKTTLNDSVFVPYDDNNREACICAGPITGSLIVPAPVTKLTLLNILTT